MINENTPNDINIATTDQCLNLQQMFNVAVNPSIGRQIFNTIRLNGPTAGFFAVRKKDNENGFQILRNEVEVFPSDPINTGLTNEVVQDIYSQYGAEANTLIGQLLRRLANEQENIKTFEFLEAQSKVEPDLQLSDSLNAEFNLFEITQKANELIFRSNSKVIRTYEAFCVIPYYLAAPISTLSNYAGSDENATRGYFINKIGFVKYYLNPDPTSTMAYVGLKDTLDFSKSSAIFSPFDSTISTAYQPDTGNENYFIFNRFAITASPLHSLNNEMLFKFNVFQ